MISGGYLGEAALQFVQSIQIEQSLHSEDLITIQMANPIKDQPGKVRTSELIMTNSRAFMPGNLVKVYLGFGNSVGDQFVAAGLIRKYMPRFPEQGMPTIEIKAFGAGCLMMDGSWDINAKGARSFPEDTALNTMVEDIAMEYGFARDGIEPTVARPAVETVKKAGMSDYDFCKGLANMLGFEFSVKWDDDAEEWVMYWRTPKAHRTFFREFTWGPDAVLDRSRELLLSFEPQFAIQNASTDVEVFYYDRDTLTWEKVIYPPEDPEPQRGEAKPEFEWTGDAETADEQLARVGDSESARGLRIQADGIAVEVVPTQNFNSAEEAYAWAEGWWRARQQHLITGNGRVYGNSKMAPGQVHDFQGLGPGLSGLWYIIECTHNFDATSGYFVDFTARRVLG